MSIRSTHSCTSISQVNGGCVNTRLCLAVARSIYQMMICMHASAYLFSAMALSRTQYHFARCLTMRSVPFVRLTVLTMPKVKNTLWPAQVFDQRQEATLKRKFGPTSRSALYQPTHCRLPTVYKLLQTNRITVAMEIAPLGYVRIVNQGGLIQQTHAATTLMRKRDVKVWFSRR